jgi:hypothetical protein
LRITGTASLNLSAMDWASLKLRGRIRCTFTADDTASRFALPRAGGRVAGARGERAAGAGSGAGSDQSSGS